VREHLVSQGSLQWRQLRCGIPTASQFHRIITPKTRKRSSQLEQYARELAAEKLLGQPIEMISTKAMQQGNEREESAVATYEIRMGVDAEPVGFMTTDDARVGASPDRIVRGLNRLLECKCPQPHTHIGYLLGAGPDENYFCQLQGQLYVAEFDQVDIISFYPGLPDAIVEVRRDEAFIAALVPLLDELTGQINAHMETLAAMGHFPPHTDLELAEDPLGLTEDDLNTILAGRGA
jgi:hypothetical protein